MLKTQKSTNVKNLTKIVWFKQFSKLDRISRGADVLVGQSVAGPACENARHYADHWGYFTYS